MSSRCRIFVGDLPADVKGWEVEELFQKFGRIVQVDLVMTREGRRNPPFCFVEFEDRRSVDSAIEYRNGIKFGGSRIRVARSRDCSPPRGDGGSGGRAGVGDGIGRGFRPVRRGNYRVRVTGLPRGVSYQDLKAHMRGAGGICWVDILRDGSAFVEYSDHRHMKRAVEIYDRTKYPSKEGDRGSSEIRVEEDAPASSHSGRRSRSRSRSKNRTYSPVRLIKRSPRNDGAEQQPQSEYTNYYENYNYV